MHSSDECQYDRTLGHIVRRAFVASMLLAHLGGCCGGRLVSVQLYEEDRSGDCTADGEKILPGGLGHLHQRHGNRLALDGSQEFRGPALIPPLPRFHPVPTQRAFEPRYEHAPLRLLDTAPLPADASIHGPEPTPARPPSPSGS